MRIVERVASERLRIVDRYSDHRRSVLVAGAGKNSSALVCDALVEYGGFRYLFEPFSDLSEPSTGLQNQLVWTEYISPAKRDSALRRHVRAIVTGRVRSPHIDRWTSSGTYERRLISECRLNLWLKWLRVNFAGMPIVLVLRHPCAVVAARLLLEKETRLPSLLGDGEFVGRYLAPFGGTIERAESELEKHALMWAIEHYVPLHELHGDAHVVRYEQFLAEPDDVMDRLATALQLERRPGAGVSERRLREHAGVLDGWRRQLSADEARRIMKIVEAFGLDMYSDNEGSTALQIGGSNDASYARDWEEILAGRQHGDRDFNRGLGADVASFDQSIEPSKRQHDNGDLRRELDANFASFERSIERLKHALFEISDGDRWQMYDWDWLWPKTEPSIVCEAVWSTFRAGRNGNETGLLAALQSVYADFRSMPPALAPWLAQWDGDSNTFVRYMIDRLDAHAAALGARVRSVDERLERTAA